MANPFLGYAEQRFESSLFTDDAALEEAQSATQDLGRSLQGLATGAELPPAREALRELAAGVEDLKAEIAAFRRQIDEALEDLSLAEERRRLASILRSSGDDP